MKFKILFNVLFLSIIFRASLLFGTTYFLAKNGNDNNAGTLSQPWLTINKANSVLLAGDTVFIRGGVYKEIIRPTHSGSENNYIVYKAYNYETVTITDVTNGVELENISYVIIEGFHIIGVEKKFVYIKGSGAHHNIIQNCYMDGNTSGHGWGSVHIEEKSTYNKILNNTIKNGHGDVVYISNKSCYNLIQDNDIDGRNCGHSSLSIRGFNEDDIVGYNIIKNNLIHGGSDDNVNISQWTEHNFIEGNMMYDCATLADVDGSGYKACGGYYNVVRNNIAYDNDAYGMGIYTNLYDPPSPEANGNVFYHNVCYDNGSGGMDMHCGFRLLVYEGGTSLHHTIVINNIIYNNLKEMYLAVAGGDNSKYYQNVFQRNNIFHNEVGDETIKFFFKIYSLTGMMSNYPDEFKDNLEVNPLFVDARNHNFQLLPNSPMIDAGTYLTYTEQANNGDQIIVENAAFFCDGFGIIEGDLIQLEDQSETARIVHVDYDNNIITIDRALTWQGGQGVSLPYHGSAPDIGAYEYGNASSCNANVTAIPTSGYVPLTVNFTGNTRGGTPPYNYRWDFGDNVFSSEQNPTHTYSMVQSYTVTLTVTDYKGKQDNAFIVIKVLNANNFDYLIHHTFEQQEEGWGNAIGTTAYKKDNSTAYMGRCSIHVYATGDGSKLSIGVNPEGWNINQYPILSVAYKIPNNVPVGMFFETEIGWICLGGSKNYDAGNYPVNNAYRLTDDGAWHVITLNVAEKIKEVYPSATTVIEFEWYTQSNGKQGDEFWFDDVMIFADNNTSPAASISMSDPSPTKAGAVEVTLTTSKSVINVPTPLTFREADNSITSIVLSGVVPGTIFKGTFFVNETVAEGVGYFSLPPDILLDVNNNKGNEITSGAYVKIDRNVPSKPQNLQGYFTK
jgi:PKD repeat protein